MVLLALTATSHAGPGQEGPRGNRTSPKIACQPAPVVSPIVSTSPVSICLSGFGPGDLVDLRIPWRGTRDQYSWLMYSKYVDASGGFCLQSPPSWTTMELEAGTYPIESTVHTNGNGGGKRGPTGTLEVASQ